MTRYRRGAKRHQVHKCHIITLGGLMHLESSAVIRRTAGQAGRFLAGVANIEKRDRGVGGTRATSAVGLVALLLRRGPSTSNQSDARHEDPANDEGRNCRRSTPTYGAIKLGCVGTKEHRW